MKYIRTKDQIEEVLKEEGELLFTKHGYIPRDMVIKESDDIEELLDKIVICGENGDKFIYDPFKLDGWIVEGTLYGAIWTDKGLIYVAKLTDKGEWELL